MADHASVTEPATLSNLRAAGNRYRAETIDFARRLIQTPSLSGAEADVADLLASTLRSLAYDDVWVDGVGNVIGVVRGVGNGPSVQFNAHLDHVDVGDERLWERPPYAAVVDRGVLYGRGASDVKAAIAAQAYLWPTLRELGLRPVGDVYVVGVVLEEVGGFGTAHLCTHLRTDLAVVGEASANHLRRGHRGRVPIRVTFTGLSAHASVPDRARNPHYACARFLLVLEELVHPGDSTFGSSSSAPTTITTDRHSANVTPAHVSVTVDWRSLPHQTTDSVVDLIRTMAETAADQVDGVRAHVEAIERAVRSYTGVDAVMPPTRGFETQANHAALIAATRALTEVLARPVEVGTWGFSTDGGHLAQAGITTIGFAPSEERFAHTIHDQVNLDQLVEAVAGNAALAITLTQEAP